MKQYLILILIAFYLFSSGAYATKTFLDKDHLHNDVHKCIVHEHHHSHNGSSHQHNHGHSKTNINHVDFFTDAGSINLYDFANLRQTYLVTDPWIPNPTLESLFRPPRT